MPLEYASRVIGVAAMPLAHSSLAYLYGNVALMNDDPGTSERLRTLRSQLGMSQPVFARAYGLALGTLRQWEQGTRAPEGAALTLIRAIEREPDLMLRILTDGDRNP